MKNILILAGLALFVVSCGSQKTATAAAPTEPSKTVALTPELEAGRSMYENNCAKCHKLYDPKKFTKEEWVFCPSKSLYVKAVCVSERIKTVKLMIEK